MGELGIGVVGYSLQTFDVSAAKDMILEAYNALEKDYSCCSKTAEMFL